MKKKCFCACRQANFRRFSCVAGAHCWGETGVKRPENATAGNFCFFSTPRVVLRLMNPVKKLWNVSGMATPPQRERARVAAGCARGVLRSCPTPILASGAAGQAGSLQPELRWAPLAAAGESRTERTEQGPTARRWDIPSVGAIRVRRQY